MGVCPIQDSTDRRVETLATLLCALRAALRPIGFHTSPDRLPRRRAHSALSALASLTAATASETSERSLQGGNIPIDVRSIRSQFGEDLLKRAAHVVRHRLSLRSGIGHCLAPQSISQSNDPTKKISVTNSSARAIRMVCVRLLDNFYERRLADNVMPQTLHQSATQRPVTKRRFKRFVDQVTSRIRRLYQKLRGIEATLEPLADHVGHAEEELLDLEERVDRLEKKRSDSTR